MTHCTPENLNELRKLAESLNGKDWRYAGLLYGDHGERYYGVETVENFQTVVGESGPSELVAQFIAAANSAVILELLALLPAQASEGNGVEPSATPRRQHRFQGGLNKG